MRIFLFLSIFLLVSGFNLSFANDESSRLSDETAVRIHSLASLSSHVNSLKKDIQSYPGHFVDEHIIFTEEEVSRLWKKCLTRSSKVDDLNQKILDYASQKYDLAKNLISESQYEKAFKYLFHVEILLNRLWKESIQEEFASSFAGPVKSFLRQKENPNLEDNPYISSSIRKKIRPYAIPMDHPMKPVLDDLFSKRVTLHERTLEKAGFKVIDRRKRSFICVASHPSLPGYLLKLHFDLDKRQKQERASWEWLVKRCEGAEKIQKIITKYDIKHFVCAKKWIYCLPAEPSPPKNHQFTRHLAVLLVTDMNLISMSDNLRAWDQNITKSHLNELYILITRGKGSSYRPDNMPFTVDGKIAFIDTEYPNLGPDFESIRNYLSTDMRHYWDKLVSEGGI